MQQSSQNSHFVMIYRGALSVFKQVKSTQVTELGAEHKKMGFLRLCLSRLHYPSQINHELLITL